MIVAAPSGAIAGGQLGYAIGRRAGPTLFDRRDGRLFRRSQLDATTAYFARYGRSTILIARFVPFVRTVVSPAAGAARVPISVFASYNALGGLVWAVVVAGAGYLLGGLIPIERYGLVVTIGIAAVSLIPLILHLRAMKRHRRPNSSKG